MARGLSKARRNMLSNDDFVLEIGIFENPSLRHRDRTPNPDPNHLNECVGKRIRCYRIRRIWRSASGTAAAAAMPALVHFASSRRAGRDCGIWVKR